MNDGSSDSRRWALNQVSLRTFFGCVAVASVFLAMTRPSVAASIMVVVAIFFAIGSIFLRQIRGEIVVLSIVGVPILLLALAFAFGVFLFR